MLLKWYEEVSSGKTRSSSETSNDRSKYERPDLFEDDGTYGIDPTFDPKCVEDYSSTSSSDNAVLVDPRQVIPEVNNNSGKEST
ncbi:hypothetical protein JTB14_007336 [Gonioctena quinquepunctata]|nr:hypothetical protein JTB14_007336 [Gonioctena quinquepunctata]